MLSWNAGLHNRTGRFARSVRLKTAGRKLQQPGHEICAAMVVISAFGLQFLDGQFNHTREAGAFSRLTGANLDDDR
ncbi:hypothetical protein SAMN07250955_10270 [Arboricoccus pini]|uniref:Uncharacterized protein n=1 Tax=Arboricoccus pini TaxID=1963835 RepID=A0A212QN75_9PROT|nr:hypothetical protein SAMN07250955_10270 [Arboricoccus pini]